MFLLFFAGLLMVSWSSSIYADLNGIAAPIFVENTYTFTNGERADGFVSFKNGFDLPTNGTVTLNLAPGCMTQGVIGFNNGTLILESPLRLGGTFNVFKGYGFIQGGALGNQDILITVEKDLRPRGRIVFKGRRLELRGYGWVRFYPSGETGTAGGGFDVSNIDQRAELNSLIVETPAFEWLHTSSIKPDRLNLRDIDLLVSGTAIFNLRCPIVQVGGSCRFGTGQTAKIVIDQTLELRDTALLQIQTLSYMSIGNVAILGDRSHIILENSILDFYNQTSTGLALNIGPNKGKISVVGKSILRSSGNHPLYLDKDTILLFEAGSRLSLDKGVNFIVE